MPCTAPGWLVKSSLSSSPSPSGVPPLATRMFPSFLPSRRRIVLPRWRWAWPITFQHLEMLGDARARYPFLPGSTLFQPYSLYTYSKNRRDSMAPVSVERTFQGFHFGIRFAREHGTDRGHLLVGCSDKILMTSQKLIIIFCLIGLKVGHLKTNYSLKSLFSLIIAYEICILPSKSQ